MFPISNVLRSRKHDDAVQPYAFDILTFDGEDLRPVGTKNLSSGVVVMKAAQDGK